MSFKLKLAAALAALAGSCAAGGPYPAGHPIGSAATPPPTPPATSATVAPTVLDTPPPSLFAIRGVTGDARIAYLRAAYFNFPRNRGVKRYYDHGSVRYWHHGGKFRNFERRLPRGGDYFEYDMYTRRSPEEPRGTRRIVVNLKRQHNGKYPTWYTTDHYNSFHVIH
ncbi:ribonuclease [Sinosporangium album]|uniref:Ribonuclease n=1 Tax=Sinosporangium album TaxID=504805 RepID=A0A1G7RT59_9ACTN|nr:ribonuclease [Sinosporangium album]